MNELPFVTMHAIERYIERVRPTLDRRGAAAEIVRLLRDHAVRVEARPEWIHPHELSEANDYWFTVADSIAFPVLDGHVPTCLTRCGLSDVARRARTQSNGFQRRLNRSKKVRERTGAVRREAKRRGRRVAEDFA